MSKEKKEVEATLSKMLTVCDELAREAEELLERADRQRRIVMVKIREIG